MPELPEVEGVRRTLEPRLLGRTVTGVEVCRRDFVTPLGAPVKRLVGRRFVRTLRHGKKLFCVADDGQTLLLHLGMTGRVECARCEEGRTVHTHFVLELEGKEEIRFRDPRRFGGIWYYRTLETAWEREVTGRMGVDALELTVGDLGHWGDSRGRLKARLLGQKDVAGLGNIYVDEALWMVKLHPLQTVCRIKGAKVGELVAAIREVLGRSIALGGTTVRDYRNADDKEGEFARELQAYGRTGLACGRCGATMVGIQAAGRTTVFCPACQRER